MKIPRGKFLNRYDENKMNIKVLGCGLCIGFIWLNIGML
jgi:hypothetical protein